MMLGGLALWQADDLGVGTMRQLGAGMIPKVLAYLTGLCGLLMLIGSFLRDGAGLERWSLRGPLFVLGAAVVFGLTVRPLGLAVAGPLVIFIGGMASHETKVVESVIFSLVMTVFCLVLFKYVLTLPVPVAPWLIGY